MLNNIAAVITRTKKEYGFVVPTKLNFSVKGKKTARILLQKFQHKKLKYMYLHGGRK